MKKHYRKTLIAAAIAGAMASGMSGTASAYEYAMAHLNVADFVFFGASPGQVVTVNSFTFNLSNQATLTGFPLGASAASCNNVSPLCNAGPGPVLDASVVSLGAPARAENSYAFIGPLATSYATADSVIRSAQLVNGTPTSTEAISEVNVGVNGVATGNTTIQSNTTIAMTVGTTAGSFIMAFNADPDMRAAISSLPGTHSAQSNLTASFTFQSNTRDISISWSPQGTGSNDCTVTGAASAGITCVEIADSQDLNRNVPTGTNPSDVTFSHEAADVLTPFGILVSGLSADTYSLGLTTTTSANVVSVVPEPASIALLGLGLLGMGFSLRRRIRNS